MAGRGLARGEFYRGLVLVPVRVRVYVRWGGGGTKWRWRWGTASMPFATTRPLELGGNGGGGRDDEGDVEDDCI